MEIFIYGAIWFNIEGVVFVFIIAAFAVLASIIGTLFIRGEESSDPFKDTIGPALDILIKLMTTISLVFAATTLF